MLSYVQKDPYEVQTYQDVLLPKYQSEVFALYKQVILKDGETGASRTEYSGLATWLKGLVSVGGSDVANECVRPLKPRYKKRPAHRKPVKGDELTSIYRAPLACCDT